MSTRRKLILIADDNRDVRFVFGAILNHDGFDVVEASDGMLAVEYARRYVPDLILMDREMPLLDGIGAAKQIRAEPLTAQIPIILVTGGELTRDESMLVGTLFGGFLPKPVMPKTVAKEVERFIGPSPAPSPYWT